MEKEYDPTGPEREPEPESWVPVAWCQDYWHSDNTKPDRPCPTCGQTDQMDASTSPWAAAYSGEISLGAPEPVHYDPDTLDRLSPCNLNLGEVAAAHQSTNPARVTCVLCVASLTAPVVDETETQNWWFSFGSGQEFDGYYTVVNGTYDGARNLMFAHFGNRWSFQYGSAEAAGVEQFGLRRLDASEWPPAELPDEDDEDDPGFLKPAPGCGHPMPQGVDCCISTAPAAPVRHTVSVEVLNDELRAVPMDIEVATGATNYPPEEARVAVVLRIDGKPVCVPDVDTDWSFLQGAESFAVLMDQARGRAVNADAELLMPGADVLAVLSGQPGLALTAPVHVLRLDVEAGMVPVDALGAGTAPVEQAVACLTPECEFGATCVVLDIDGRSTHGNGYERTRVRIPATTEVQQ